MKFASLFASAALVFAQVSTGWAGATLQGSSVGIVALTGDKAVELAPGAELSAGTRIVVKRSATLKDETVVRFADGCSIKLAPGQVFTVGEVSPCSFQADGEVGLSAPLVIGGVVVAGAIVGGVIAATSGNKGSASVPYLSY